MIVFAVWIFCGVRIYFACGFNSILTIVLHFVGTVTAAILIWKWTLYPYYWGTTQGVVNDEYVNLFLSWIVLLIIWPLVLMFYLRKHARDKKQISDETLDQD